MIIIHLLKHGTKWNALHVFLYRLNIIDEYTTTKKSIKRTFQTITKFNWDHKYKRLL